MESRYFTLPNHLKIHTLIAGDITTPPLVLLHGWPSSSLLWRHMIPELSKRFYVVAPDLPGHGKSDKPYNIIYNLSFLRNFILDFLDAANLKNPHLVAHDLGGMGGLSFVARYPEKIDKFIIMNTGPYMEIPFLLNVSLYLLKQKYLTRLFLNRFVFKQVLKNGFCNKSLITPEIIDTFRKPWISSKDGRNAFAKTIDIPISQMVEPIDTLQKITSPTLILWGKNDLFFPFKTARRLHDDIKDSTLIGVENAGHFLHEEKPQFILDQIRLFLIKPEDT